MDANDLELKDEVFAVVGAAIEVSNTPGNGLHEKPHENALVVEFQQRDIPYSQQPRFPIIYKNVQVGEYIPDLIAYESLVVDTKTVERITDTEIGQMMNYLAITGRYIGLLLNLQTCKTRMEARDQHAPQNLVHSHLFAFIRG